MNGFPPLPLEGYSSSQPQWGFAVGFVHGDAATSAHRFGHLKHPRYWLVSIRASNVHPESLSYIPESYLPNS